MAAMEILYLSSTYKLIYVFKIREIYKQICMFIIAMISDVEYREIKKKVEKSAFFLVEKSNK